ncbi:integrase catalytic domain-containing protein [Trichonephila clavipes]|nr:integrase catalytic domain-containing protein [Trichonephila clavipes]
MNRVVYGTTYAPFLAQRVLKQLVTDDGQKYPLAASAVSADIFMNNLISGCSSISSANQLKQELISLFSGAGMQLHKWLTNCIELLSNFDVSDGDVSLTIPDETKALGLLWKSQKDTLAFSVSSITNVSDSSTITKSIPRYILLDDALRIEPHGYCDSSLRVYGAAFNVKCLHNSGNVSTNVLCSKSRIAPLKSVTIPRLAAVLLAKLIRKTIKSMKIPFNDIVLWTYSTIVLAWIKKYPSVLKPFVKNRISVIQHLTEVSSWKHVQSQENPADIISRGIDTDKIQDFVLWWYGPSVCKTNQLCLRNAKATNQVMEDLPSDRVTVSRVFTKVGIDYAGPFVTNLYGTLSLTF